MSLISLKRLVVLAGVSAICTSGNPMALAQETGTVVTEAGVTLQSPASEVPVAPIDPLKISYDEIEVPPVLQSGAPGTGETNSFQPPAVTATDAPAETPIGVPAVQEPIAPKPTTQAPGHPLAPIQNSFQPPVQERAAPPSPFTPASLKREPVAPAATAPATPLQPVVSQQAALIRTRIQSPPFINVNKPAEVGIEIINSGDAPVAAVSLLATLPEHTRLVSAEPEPAAVEGNQLRFDLASLAGHQSGNITLSIVPTEKLPINIRTAIQTEQHQQVALAVRQPELKLEIKGPAQINVGQQIAHQLIIHNTGDGDATDVKIDTLWPAQLTQLETSQTGSIDRIPAGGSTTIDFTSQAIAPGTIELKTTAASDDGLQPAAISSTIKVFEPQLQIAATGPKINFVNRSGIYTIQLENPGEVDITDVQIALAVPTGMKVNTISREARVDAQQGVLNWTFERIAAGASEQIQMIAIVTEEGRQVCDIRIDSRETAEKQIKLSTEVTTRADLGVSIKNLSGPIQTGSKAVFSVDIANQGSRQAADVSVQIDLPEGLQAVPTKDLPATIKDQQIQFTQAQIGPGKSVSFNFSVIGKLAGEHVVRSTTQLEGSQRKIISEDSVLVYDVDQTRISESLKPNVQPRR